MKIDYNKAARTVTVTFNYDAKGKFPKSKTGKNEMVASSMGFMGVPDSDLRISVNVIRGLREDGASE